MMAGEKIPEREVEFMETKERSSQKTLRRLFFIALAIALVTPCGLRG
jgi:hypothetical protein